jgi:bifunctional DNase/RNase
MSQMVEVMIDSVRVSLISQQRVVLLRRLDMDRYLPIWIGPFEAEAITIALQEIEMARPQTHDLILQTLARLDARLARVEIVSVKEDIFYGNLVIEKEGEMLQIDARPSDSIALAVRSHVPIWVSDEIFDTAGITLTPDMHIDSCEAEEENPSTPEQDAETEKRLSIYEDFLQNIDFDQQDGDAGGEPHSPESPEPPDPPEPPKQA